MIKLLTYQGKILGSIPLLQTHTYTCAHACTHTHRSANAILDARAATVNKREVPALSGLFGKNRVHCNYSRSEYYFRFYVLYTVCKLHHTVNTGSAFVAASYTCILTDMGRKRKKATEKHYCLCVRTFLLTCYFILSPS